MNKDPFGQSQIKGFPPGRGWQSLFKHEADHLIKLLLAFRREVPINLSRTVIYF
jgi:hypothetical protein